MWNECAILIANTCVPACECDNGNCPEGMQCMKMRLKVEKDICVESCNVDNCVKPETTILCVGSYEVDKSKSNCMCKFICDIESVEVS